MARLSKEAQIEIGILTPSVAADLSGHARTTIRNWAKDGTLTATTISSRSREKRISALELIKFLIENCWPFERNLAVAAANYARRNQYDHLAYTQEILDSYGHTSPKQRKEIVFVPNTLETIVWDKAGNVVSPLPPSLTTSQEGAGSDATIESESGAGI